LFFWFFRIMASSGPAPGVNEYQERGWNPTRGIPPAARGKNEDARGYVNRDSGPPVSTQSNMSDAAKQNQVRMSPRSRANASNAGGQRMRGGVSQPSRRDAMQQSRTERQKRGGVLAAALFQSTTIRRTPVACLLSRRLQDRDGAFYAGPAQLPTERGRVWPPRSHSILRPHQEAGDVALTPVA